MATAQRMTTLAIMIVTDNNGDDATDNDDDVDGNGATNDDINDDDCNGTMDSDYDDNNEGAMGGDMMATMTTLMATA